MDNFLEDLSKIFTATRQFINEMEQRMCDKYREGFRGWDDRKNMADITQKLCLAIEKRKWVDVANFAMMLNRFENEKM